MTGSVPARRNSRSLHRARPASWSAAGAVMKSLFVASHASTSPVGIVRVKPNDAVSPGPNADPAGRSTAWCRSSSARTSASIRGSSPPRAWSAPPVRSSLSRSSSATQSSSRSLLVQMTPSRPPGRSTRAISGTARGRSSQCHAVETNTASALASGRGMASPRPSRTSSPGERRASTSRIRGSGSTATTRAARPSSARVNSPVPAARSTATSHPAGTSQSSAAGAGPGRTRS